MKPYYADESVTLYHGDCPDVLRQMPESSIDAVVTDPPYGLEFMGNDWDKFGVGKQPKIGQPDGSKFRQSMGTPSFTDNGNPTCRNCGGDKYRNGPRKCACGNPSFGNPQAESMRGFQRWSQQWAVECLRVLKPGGHILAFGGSRTWHRLAAAVEDAGFEMRDSIAWLYGSGFPKSLDVSKAIDKAAGAEREIVRVVHGAPAGRDDPTQSQGRNYRMGDDRSITAPATDAAELWTGWGTALKPAFEPIVVGRKPLCGTVAANVLEHGTGALNIDACRVGRKEGDRTKYGRDRHLPHANITASLGAFAEVTPYAPHDEGRWPTNVVLDESQAAVLDAETGVTTSRIGKPRGAASGDGWGMAATGAEYDDRGGASRFFPTFHYEAKAPTSERPRGEDGTAHPTVKPLDLMRWLIRLVTPPGGTVLDPFNGSGTTGEACIVEGFRYLGIEREEKYLRLTVDGRLGKPIARDIFGAAS